VSKNQNRRRKVAKRPAQSESYFVAQLAERARHPSIANPVSIEDLCDKLAAYLDASQIALVRDATTTPPMPTRVSGAVPVTPTSVIRWRWPTSWRTCAWITRR
jgi:hypothetical protein